jgi:hypothetical protein
MNSCPWKVFKCFRKQCWKVGFILTEINTFTVRGLCLSWWRKYFRKSIMNLGLEEERYIVC